MYTRHTRDPTSLPALPAPGPAAPPPPPGRRTRVTVEGDHRPARPGTQGACGRVEPPRPVGRAQLAGIEPPLELLGSAAAVEGRPPLRRCVEEHRQAELAEPRTDRFSRTPCPIEGGRHQRDDRHDVGGADPWMRAVGTAEVDPIARGLG